jgi:tungstate transport system ATP-binding protein
MKDAPSILPLELRQIVFEARGQRLIKDLSCSFESRKRSIIIGPNGAGKSLLLRICHGLLSPTQGEVLWRGSEAQEKSDPAIHQAMVFQRPVMLRRSVKANVDYALYLRRIPKRQRKERIEEVLKKAGLLRLIDQPARTLSFGEQQKLALARAWALSPQVLFLDEPTASLDPSATHMMEEIIEAIRQAGTKIVMTTHDLGQARRLADEILFLHRGRLLEKSAAADFFERPENDLARAFLAGELLWWKRKHRP